ncbi:MAG TPA: hypothetical protein VLZ12_11010 [Verrucomicrobiae bacterium]|nr:hypothetical protein [Verrucomicrobiae bacterium]
MDSDYPTQPLELPELMVKVNEALEGYSDKDWNYSRISLEPCLLQSHDLPYVLWLERIATQTNQGKDELKRLREEVTWGSKHCSELGFAELASLRINKALLEATADEYWDHVRPIVHLVKKEHLAQQGIAAAFWYRVREVPGEDFDSR